jgi:hypothetical protein
MLVDTASGLEIPGVDYKWYEHHKAEPHLENSVCHHNDHNPGRDQHVQSAGLYSAMHEVRPCGHQSRARQTQVHMTTGRAFPHQPCVCRENICRLQRRKQSILHLRRSIELFQVLGLEAD